MTAEHLPQGEQVTPEALKWALMNFIDQTTAFYNATERLTKGPGWPLRTSPKRIFEVSRQTINACLKDVNGIDHFYTGPDGTDHSIRIVEWNGMDPSENGKHMWTVVERNRPVPLSLGIDAVDEMRQSILEQLSA